MTSSLITLFENWSLAGYFYTVFLVFARLGATLSLLPGFGEQFVPARIKLFFALALTVAIYPVAAPSDISQLPELDVMLFHIGSEILVGLMFGSWVRFIYLSLTIAAGFFSQILGITNIFDSSLEPGGAPALSGFLSFTALAFLSFTGGHYFILEAFMKSYDLIAFTELINISEASLSIVDAGKAAIEIGLKLSLPFLAVGFLVNIGLGFVNRAMPQIPVFFVGQPLIIGVGFLLLSLLIPTMIFSWYEALQQFLFSIL